MKNSFNSYLLTLVIVLMLNVNYCLAIKCIECKSDDKSCTIDPKKVKGTCDTTEAKKQCYLKLDDKGLIERGCGAENICEKPEKCETCKEGLCNFAIIPDTRPKCYVCDGKDCFKVDEKQIEYCQYIKSDSTEHCFTKTDGDKIIRGCLTQPDLKCDDSNSCEKCQNNKDNEYCNNVAKQEGEFSCYNCRSDVTSDCVNDAAKTTELKCKDKTKGCYAERHGSLIMRTCAEILTDNEISVCTKSNSKSCIICNESKCNAAKLNGAIVNSISSILLITSIFVWKCFN